MRTHQPQGTGKKLATDHVACPKCAAPMLITTIEINRVRERITYRCDPCKEMTVKEDRFD